jgi:hypothetical protein
LTHPAETQNSRGDSPRPLIVFRGGDGGIRTPDLYSAIVALSQLSYVPESDVIIAGRAQERQRAAARRSPSCDGDSAADDGQTGATRSTWRMLYLCPDTVAGVTQLVECLLPKQNVVGSSPITRSAKCPAYQGQRPSRVGPFFVARVNVSILCPSCFPAGRAVRGGHPRQCTWAVRPKLSTLFRSLHPWSLIDNWIGMTVDDLPLSSLPAKEMGNPQH